MIVFSHNWFEKHQRALLRFLNTPGIGKELRSILNIDSCERITKVLPDSYIVSVEPKLNIGTFWTAPVIANRLHYYFLPIWKLAHWFDMNIANSLIPALNLGFDTLTFYPDPFPAAAALDGYVGRIGVDETFATIIAGTGTGGLSDSAADVFCYLRGSTTLNQFDQLRRCFTLFNTAAIGLGTSISSATYGLVGKGKGNDLGQTNLTVVSSNPADPTNLVDADFTTLGSTSFGSFDYTAFDTGDTNYNTVSLNASGLAAISLNGVTKYGTKLEWDRAGSFTGTWALSQVTFYNFECVENASGTAKAPKLIVTYIPVGGLTNPFFTTVGAKRMR